MKNRSLERQAGDIEHIVTALIEEIEELEKLNDSLSDRIEELEDEIIELKFERLNLLMT